MYRKHISMAAITFVIVVTMVVEAVPSVHAQTPDIAARVGAMLDSGTDGTKGLYLEQIDGGILANLMNDYPFEPASTLKVAPHLYTIQQVQAGSVSLGTRINRYYEPLANSTCPRYRRYIKESIELADLEMMQRSDNTRTKEIVEYFGSANINAMMTNLGMADSSINHVFGCGGPIPNVTTLDDLAILYKSVIDGTSLDMAHQQIFYDQMAGTSYDFTGVFAAAKAIVDEEAPIGMSTASKDNYKASIELAYKAGNYTICSGSCVYHISLFGYAQLPFCDGGGPREYVFGIFIADSTSDTNSGNTFNATKAELLREQIRDGLASCMETQSCQNETATLIAHQSGGRVYSQLQSCGWNCTQTVYYAVGSNEYLGTNGSATVTLYSTDQGTSWTTTECE